jgi:hypothetical protein
VFFALLEVEHPTMNQTFTRRKFLSLPAVAALAAGYPLGPSHRQPAQPAQTATQVEQTEPASTVGEPLGPSAYNELVQCITFMALVVNVQTSAQLHQLERIQRLERLVPGPLPLPDRGHIDYEYSLPALLDQLQEKITHARHALHL